MQEVGAVKKMVIGEKCEKMEVKLCHLQLDSLWSILAGSSTVWEFVQQRISASICKLEEVERSFSFSYHHQECEKIVSEEKLLINYAWWRSVAQWKKVWDKSEASSGKQNSQRFQLDDNSSSLLCLVAICSQHPLENRLTKLSDTTQLLFFIPPEKLNFRFAHVAEREARKYFHTRTNTHKRTPTQWNFHHDDFLLIAAPCCWRRGKTSTCALLHFSLSYIYCSEAFALVHTNIGLRRSRQRGELVIILWCGVRCSFHTAMSIESVAKSEIHNKRLSLIEFEFNGDVLTMAAKLISLALLSSWILSFTAENNNIIMLC